MATIQNDRDVLLQATSPRYANSSACTLLITADTPIFHVTTGGAGSPSVVNLTANLISIPGTVTWSVVGASSVTPTGNTCTLAFANMTAASATVTATITYNSVVYTDSKVIAKVVDGATGTAGSPGTPGTDGTKSITLAAFKWSNAGVGSYAQAMSYTWSTGVVSAYPSGWSASASTSPGTGYTLYMISMVLSDTLSATTTAANWSSATSGSIGYRQDGSIGLTGSPGTPGTPGSPGQSARVAYVVNTSSTVPGAVTPGSGDVPPTSSAGTWSFTATSSLTAGQYMYQVDGLYTSGGNIAWGNPYLSNLKVGSLSAISAELGTVGITATGNIHSGTHGYADGTAGFFLGYSGSAYQFEVAASSTVYMRYSSATAKLTFAGDIETTGHVTAAGSTSISGYQTAILGGGSANSGMYGVVGVVNDAAKAGVRGDNNGAGPGVIGLGVAYCGVYGIDLSGKGVWGHSSTGKGVYGDSDYSHGVFGVSTYAGASGVFGWCATTGGTGTSGQHTGSGDGVAGVSSSGRGVYGQSASSYGVYGTSGSGTAVYGTSSSGYAGYFSLGAGVYVNGNLQVGGSMWLYGNGSYYGTWTYASDIRLKENIESISSGLAEVMRLNPVTFTFRHAPGMGLAKGVQIGWIANEIQASLVDKPYVANIIIKDDGDIGLLRIQDNKLIPLLVKAIQELKSEIDELKGVQK